MLSTIVEEEEGLLLSIRGGKALDDEGNGLRFANLGELLGLPSGL